MAELDTYRALLPINKHRLDDELEVQADVMERISDRVSSLNARVESTENDLKICEARLFRSFKETDEKGTDKAADSSVKRNPERAKMFKCVLDARQELDQWRGLYEAWRARGFSISKLCDLYVAQYFTTNSHSISSKSDRRRGEEDALRERRPYEGGHTRNSDSVTRRRIREG